MSPGSLPPTVAFASGKGGVGKSTTAVNVAVALANEGVRVGLIDADVYGPDVPAMVGVTRSTPTSSITLWQAPSEGPDGLEPVERFGVQIMSVQFLLGEDQSLDWQAPLVEALLSRLLHGVPWGDLDVLLVDLPPGTADLQQEVFRLLPSASVALVVTPQYVSHLDARKLVSMLRKRGIPILGGIENMSGLACPHCGNDVRLFERAAQHHTIWSHEVEQLAAVPYVLPDSTRPGMPLVAADPRAPASLAFADAARKLRTALSP